LSSLGEPVIEPGDLYLRPLGDFWQNWGMKASAGKLEVPGKANLDSCIIAEYQTQRRSTSNAHCPEFIDRGQKLADS
jgi:hypothetical protein